MANPQELALHYPLGDALPEPGRSLEVAPGVRWVRMGLPFALDHINVWLLRDTLDGREGWTIVDCGITNDASRAVWDSVFEHELAGLPVLRVIVTHMHPDHIGLAHWLCERWNCRLWISLGDYNAARISSQSTTGFGGESAAAFFASHGLTDPDALQKVRARANYYAGMVPQVPGQFRRLLDGQALRIGGAGHAQTWRCIVGYGHAPEHMALFNPSLTWHDAPSAADPGRSGQGVLISGDMVLPRISTNVSVHDLEPEGDPLPLYLTSIERLKALPADTLVLPSHGRPFVGLHTRITQLTEHHDERLDRVMQACREAPRHAADLLPVLFHRALDLHQTTFAMGEAIAHLHALWHRGQLRRAPGTDGVLRFEAT